MHLNEEQWELSHLHSSRPLRFVLKPPFDLLYRLDSCCENRSKLSVGGVLSYALQLAVLLHVPVQEQIETLLSSMIRVNLTRTLPIFTKSSRLTSLNVPNWSGTQNVEIVVGVRGAKVPTHQATISTLCEVLLQNHASPSGRSMADQPKKAASPLFPYAPSAAKPCFLISAKPWVK